MKTENLGRSFWFSLILAMLWVPIALITAHNITVEEDSMGFVWNYLGLLVLAYSVSLLAKQLNRRFKLKWRLIAIQFLIGLIFPLLVLFLVVYFSPTNHFLNHITPRRYYVFLGIFLYLTNSIYLIKIFERKLFAVLKTQIDYRDTKKNEVIVYHRGSYQRLHAEEIAVIYQEAQINWLITFDEDKHILDLTLLEVLAILDCNEFFQINRTQIINKDAIVKFHQGSYGKLILELQVKPFRAKVSKGRTKEFRYWFNHPFQK